MLLEGNNPEATSYANVTNKHMSSLVQRSKERDWNITKVPSMSFAHTQQDNVISILWKRLHQVVSAVAYQGGGSIEIMILAEQVDLRDVKGIFSWYSKTRCCLLGFSKQLRIHNMSLSLQLSVASVYSSHDLFVSTFRIFLRGTIIFRTPLYWACPRSASFTDDGWRIMLYILLCP